MTKLNRRSLLAIGAASTAVGGSSVLAGGAMGREAEISQEIVPFKPVPTENGYTTLTSDEALDYLIEGNNRFLEGKIPEAPLGPQRRLELAKGQAPFCAYVTCSDSRVPPELLFGRGLGELFIIRNAGNTVDTSAMGSIEYAVAVLKVPLVVVMGHEKCGAVDAARKIVTENARYPGAIDDMIHPILPAVLGSRDGQGNIDLNQAIKENVRRIVNRLRKESDPILLEPQKAGKVKVVGAFYELSKGKVDFFDRP